jgi:hypothetical protein
VDQVNMMIGQIRRMKVRQLLQQAINFGLVVASGTLLRSRQTLCRRARLTGATHHSGCSADDLEVAHDRYAKGRGWW